MFHVCVYTAFDDTGGHSRLREESAGNKIARADSESNASKRNVIAIRRKKQYFFLTS